MGKQQNYHISLKCLLKNTKGEILLLKTHKDSAFFGSYDFPGGRIDEDEFEISSQVILEREIYEETGIKDVKLGDTIVTYGRHKVLGKYRNNSNEDLFIFYIFFFGNLHQEQEVKISSEHESYLWVKLEDIVLEEYFIGGYLEAMVRYRRGSF